MIGTYSTSDVAQISNPRLLTLLGIPSTHVASRTSRSPTPDPKLHSFEIVGAFMSRNASMQKKEKKQMLAKGRWSRPGWKTKLAGSNKEMTRRKVSKGRICKQQ
jgi:hypothetical protein